MALLYINSKGDLFMFEKRLREIINLSFDSLYQKINGGLIKVENEASLQLQLSSILKSVGELFIFRREEIFSIELEKPITLSHGKFSKSKTPKAKIDIFISIENIDSHEKIKCAIELEFFRKVNHREPNNRYDVFKDISNLERYGDCANFGVLLVATDHMHYISQKKYSSDTADFDFRHGVNYVSGTELKYKTPVPYGEPIVLNENYEFSWREIGSGINFMRLDISCS